MLVDPPILCEEARWRWAPYGRDVFIMRWRYMRRALATRRLPLLHVYYPLFQHTLSLMPPWRLFFMPPRACHARYARRGAAVMICECAPHYYGSARAIYFPLRIRRFRHAFCCCQMMPRHFLHFITSPARRDESSDIPLVIFTYLAIRRALFSPRARARALPLLCRALLPSQERFSPLFFSLLYALCARDMSIYARHHRRCWLTRLLPFSHRIGAGVARTCQELQKYMMKYFHK